MPRASLACIHKYSHLNRNIQVLWLTHVGNPTPWGSPTSKLFCKFARGILHVFLNEYSRFFAKPGLCYCWPWPSNTTATSGLLELEFSPPWLSHYSPGASWVGIHYLHRGDSCQFMLASHDLVKLEVGHSFLLCYPQLERVSLTAALAPEF